MVDAAAPETLGLREFATRLNVKPGYVTQLKKAGRLVLDRDGRVLVAESLQLIEDTRDPARAGVAARHAERRAAAKPSPSSSAAGGQGAPQQAGGDDTPAPEVVPNDPHAKRRARALADQAEAAARKALRDEQVELGQLLQRDDVLPQIAAAVTTFRTSLESLAATLAPQLAALDDEARCKVLIDTSFEHALDDLARRFAGIGRHEWGERL